eukprot:364965-Chlamydomonas_euryale.AAC.8
MPTRGLVQTRDGQLSSRPFVGPRTATGQRGATAGLTVELARAREPRCPEKGASRARRRQANWPSTLRRYARGGIDCMAWFGLVGNVHAAPCMQHCGGGPEMLATSQASGNLKPC